MEVSIGVACHQEPACLLKNYVIRSAGRWTLLLTAVVRPQYSDECETPHLRRTSRGQARGPLHLPCVQWFYFPAQSKLSDKIEERKLRYAGHVWRYGDSRWTKFMLQAERPSQKKGKARQYMKNLSKLMRKKEVDSGMMTD